MKEKLIEEFTKISSKGQLVIPKEIRKELHIKEGDVFATMIRNDLIILKKIRNPVLRRDLIILKDIEDAWKEIEEGKCESMGAEDFLEEIKEW